MKIETLVPKEQVEKMEEEVKAQKETTRLAVEAIKNSVPRELFEELEEEVKDQKEANRIAIETIESRDRVVASLQKDVNEFRMRTDIAEATVRRQLDIIDRLSIALAKK